MPTTPIALSMLWEPTRRLMAPMVTVLGDMRIGRIYIDRSGTQNRLSWRHPKRIKHSSSSIKLSFIYKGATVLTLFRFLFGKTRQLSANWLEQRKRNLHFLGNCHLFPIPLTQNNSILTQILTSSAWHLLVLQHTGSGVGSRREGEYNSSYQSNQQRKQSC